MDCITIFYTPLTTELQLNIDKVTCLCYKGVLYYWGWVCMKCSTLYDQQKCLSVSGLLACEQALLFGRASRERASEGLLSSTPRGFAARSRVLARLASLAQIGELARRLRFTEAGIL